MIRWSEIPGDEQGAGICPTLVFLAERRAAACLFALCCDQYVSKRPGDFNESAEPRTTGLYQS